MAEITAEELFERMPKASCQIRQKVWMQLSNFISRVMAGGIGR